MKILRAIALILGWLGASYALFYLVFTLDFHWNFFNWSPRFDWQALLCVVAVVLTLVIISLLARATRDIVSRIVVALAGLLLAVWAFIYVLPAEPITEGFLKRTMPSPLWFRAGLLLVFCFPFALAIRNIARRSKFATVPAPGLEG